jgi:hypothetical protein
VPAALVTDQFFRVFGTPAAAGQLPALGSVADVVVGQRVLHQVAGGDASNVVGAPLSLSDEARAIAAVMPSDFAFTRRSKRARWC